MLVIKQVIISFFPVSHFDEYVCCSALLWVLQNNNHNLIYFKEPFESQGIAWLINIVFSP